MAENSMILNGKISRANVIRRTKIMTPERWRTVGLIFGFYTFLTLMFLPQTYFYTLESPVFINPLIAVSRLAFINLLWALLTPLVFFLGNRFPIERPKRVRNLIFHIGFSLLFGVIHTVAYHYIVWPALGESFSKITRELFSAWAVFFTNVTNNFPLYAAILTFNQAANYARKYRDREFQLQQAELEALKTQLHPHFLFNTLNAISALVYVSPPDATKTISQLSDLLRLTLHNNKAQEVTLKEELDFLRKYIQIQQTLLQERLEIEWAVEPETLDALVPNMLLQPLVENSIRHGIAPKEDGGRIEIFSRRIGANLLIEIKDTGLGAQSAPEKTEKNDAGSGIGLKNSAARLKHLYGEAQKFESGALTENAGWCVTLTIPFREQPLHKSKDEGGRMKDKLNPKTKDQRPKAKSQKPKANSQRPT